MTTAGRTAGVNHAKAVREYFEANRNRDITLDEVRLIVGQDGEMGKTSTARSVITYLRSKQGMRIAVVKRGEVWRYNKHQRRRVGPRQDIPEGKPVRVVSDEDTQRMRRLADKLVDPIEGDRWRGKEVINPVPDTEPVVTLRVIGTLRETGEVLVQGDTTQGFESGVWAMRKLG